MKPISTINENIGRFLLKTKKSSLKKYRSFSNKDPLLESIFSKLEDFDFEIYITEVKKELTKALAEWWLNPEKGIVKEEKLYSILFEYDTTWWNDRHADAYGIVKWDSFQVYEQEFDMGYDYDFATGFYAMPGVTLSFFDYFQELDHEDALDKKYEYGAYFDLPGFQELCEYATFCGYYSIHKALFQLLEEGVLAKLNHHERCLFAIGEHDMDNAALLVMGE